MLSAGRNVTAYAAKDLSALKRSEATRDLLLDLGHADVVFPLVVGEGHELVGHEPQSFSNGGGRVLPLARSGIRRPL